MESINQLFFQIKSQLFFERQCEGQAMHHQRSRHHNFEEQFEDSQMNMSENGESHPEVQGNVGDQGEPVQLIRIRPSGKIEVDESALNIVANCDLPVGFVCLVGKYRTGKSFSLNQLLYLQGKGFKVDPSTAACTEGIWMWSKPVYNEQMNCYLFFLDTQGTDSLTKGPDNDAKVFSLACLIASYFIFNSVGCIDQRSIGELNMVTTLSSHIITDQRLSTKDNEEQLNKYMPKFLWLLRDFTLQLRDQHGHRLTSSEYLESVLVDQNSLIRVNQDVRRIRRSLTTYFKDRQCVTLVRPARQQSDLQKLNTIPAHMLRKQFIEGVNQLRQKIMRKAGPKIYDGDPLYGSSIASMIQNYVEKMNQGGIPNIKTAWEHISEDEGAFAYNRAIEKYNQLCHHEFPDDQPKDDIQQLPQILGNLRHQTLSTFAANKGQGNEAYQNKLKQFLHEKQKQITRINKQLNQCRNVQILRNCVAELARNIQNNAYDGRQQDLERDLQKSKDEYNHHAKGTTKGQILSEFIASLLPTLLNSQNRPKVDDKVDESKILLDQYKSRMRQMEIQLKSAQEQVKTIKRQEMQKPPMGQKQIKDSKVKPKKGTGCCGGDCIVM